MPFGPWPGYEIIWIWNMSSPLVDVLPICGLVWLVTNTKEQLGRHQYQLVTPWPGRHLSAQAGQEGWKIFLGRYLILPSFSWISEPFIRVWQYWRVYTIKICIFPTHIFFSFKFTSVVNKELESDWDMIFFYSLFSCDSPTIDDKGKDIETSVMPVV